MNSQILLIAAGVLLVLVFFLMYRSFRLEKRIKELTQGRDGTSLENLISEALKAVDHLHENQQLAKKHRKVLEKKLADCIHKPSAIRFNPFKDSGGNQSFAASFVTENGDGIIFSSLYAQGKTSIFAKPVEEFSSEHELTQEEDFVLNESKRSVSFGD